MNDPVDVLIIGAGASGAAVAWNLAETRMRIVCLEQGDWPQSSAYPSTRRNWESRQSEDYAISPNRRAAAGHQEDSGRAQGGARAAMERKSSRSRQGRANSEPQEGAGAEMQSIVQGDR